MESRGRIEQISGDLLGRENQGLCIIPVLLSWSNKARSPPIGGGASEKNTAKGAAFRSTETT